MGCIHKGLPFCDQKGSEKVSLLRGSEPRPRGYSPLGTPKMRSRSKKAKKRRSAAFFFTLFRSSPIDPPGLNSSTVYRVFGPLCEGAPAGAGGGETKRLAAVSGIVSPSVSFADSSLAEGAFCSTHFSETASLCRGIGGHRFGRQALAPENPNEVVSRPKS